VKEETLGFERPGERNQKVLDLTGLEGAFKKKGRPVRKLGFFFLIFPKGVIHWGARVFPGGLWGAFFFYLGPFSSGGHFFNSGCPRGSPTGVLGIWGLGNPLFLGSGGVSKGPHFPGGFFSGGMLSPGEKIIFAPTRFLEFLGRVLKGGGGKKPPGGVTRGVHNRRQFLGFRGAPNGVVENFLREEFLWEKVLFFLSASLLGL